MRIRSPGFRLGAASAVAFSRSGTLLGQVGRRVAVYGVANRRIIRRSDWHYAHPSAIAFGNDDKWFAVRSTTGAISVASLADGNPLDRLPPPSDDADDSSLIAAPDDHLVEACSSGTLRVRSLGGLRVQYLEQHPEHLLGAVSVSVDQRTWAMAVNARQGAAPEQPPCRLELRTWPFATGTRNVVRDDLGVVYSIALSTVQDAVAVLHRRDHSVGNAVACLSLSNGAIVRERANEYWTGHQGFAWSPDGHLFVVGTRDGHVLLNSRLEDLGFLAGEHPSDASFSPDGALLALGYWGHGVVIPVADLHSWFLPAKSRERAV